MALDPAERRRRNVQTLVLVGALAIALLVAVLLGMVGVPRPLAITIGGGLYLVIWRWVLAAMRGRRPRAADPDEAP